MGPPSSRDDYILVRWPVAAAMKRRGLPVGLSYHGKFPVQRKLLDACRRAGYDVAAQRWKRHGDRGVRELLREAEVLEDGCGDCGLPGHLSWVRRDPAHRPCCRAQRKAEGLRERGLVGAERTLPNAAIVDVVRYRFPRERGNVHERFFVEPWVPAAADALDETWEAVAPPWVARDVLLWGFLGTYTNLAFDAVFGAARTSRRRAAILEAMPGRLAGWYRPCPACGGARHVRSWVESEFLGQAPRCVRRMPAPFRERVAGFSPPSSLLNFLEGAFPSGVARAFPPPVRAPAPCARTGARHVPWRPAWVNPAAEETAGVLVGAGFLPASDRFTTVLFDCMTAGEEGWRDALRRCVLMECAL